jgi:hypothetical protein
MDHATFDAMVGEVLSDEVSYARVETGITFSLPQRENVLARWRETVAAMRATAES